MLLGTHIILHVKPATGINYCIHVDLCQVQKGGIFTELIFVSVSVCPANWKPDSATIKPNPIGAQEYFEKVN